MTCLRCSRPGELLPVGGGVRLVEFERDSGPVRDIAHIGLQGLDTARMVSIEDGVSGLSMNRLTEVGIRTTSDRCASP